MMAYFFGFEFENVWMEFVVIRLGRSLGANSDSVRATLLELRTPRSVDQG